MAGGLEEVDCGVDDRLGVDAEVAVEVIDIAGLAEVVDAEGGNRRAPPLLTRRLSVCGWPSKTVTIGATRSAGNSSSRMSSRPVVQALAGLKCAEDKIGGRQADHIARHCRRCERVGGGDYLGHHSTDPDERDVWRLVCGPESISAGEYLAAAFFAPARLGNGGQGLVDPAAWSVGSRPMFRRGGRDARARAAASTRGLGRKRVPMRRSQAAPVRLKG